MRWQINLQSSPLAFKMSYSVLFESNFKMNQKKKFQQLKMFTKSTNKLEKIKKIEKTISEREDNTYGIKQILQIESVNQNLFA